MPSMKIRTRYSTGRYVFQRNSQRQAEPYGQNGFEHVADAANFGPTTMAARRSAPETGRMTTPPRFKSESSKLKSRKVEDTYDDVLALSPLFHSVTPLLTNIPLTGPIFANRTPRFKSESKPKSRKVEDSHDDV
jgi:hypothetical protein